MKHRDDTPVELQRETPRARLGRFIRLGSQRGAFSTFWQWFYWCGAIAVLAMLLVFVLSPLLGAFVCVGLLALAVVWMRRIERRWRDEDCRNPTPQVTRDWLGEPASARHSKAKKA
jgi:Flp pilus assembly protein TadB